MATQDEECRSDEMCVMNNKIRKEMTESQNGLGRIENRCHYQKVIFELDLESQVESGYSRAGEKLS